MAVMKFRDPNTGEIQVLGAPKYDGLSFSGVIGTTWTENSETGVKTQTISIEGMSAAYDVQMDHVYTGNDTSDGYAEFVEAENQYLTYITNGFGKTIEGGIVLTIFGDANTVEIPFVVGVI